MKRYCVLLVLMFAFDVFAKPPTKDQPATKSQDNLQALQNLLQPDLLNPGSTTQPAQTNEDVLAQLLKGQPTAATITLEPVRKESRLDPVNPFAPGDFEKEFLNYARDPATGKVSGLKLFSFKF